MTIAEFVTVHAIRFSAERTAENPHMQEGRNMDHWRIKLARSKPQRTLTMVFSMGFGHNGHPPTAADVLDCLVSDASSVNTSFDDWCREFGFDTDSRKAFRMYRACCMQGMRLNRFLGSDLVTELQECDR